MLPLLCLSLCLARPVSAEWCSTELPKRSLAEAIEWLGKKKKLMPMARYPDPILRMKASPAPRSKALCKAFQLLFQIEGCRVTAANIATYMNLWLYVYTSHTSIDTQYL